MSRPVRSEKGLCCVEMSCVQLDKGYVSYSYASLGYFSSYLIGGTTGGLVYGGPVAGASRKHLHPPPFQVTRGRTCRCTAFHQKVNS